MDKETMFKIIGQLEADYDILSDEDKDLLETLINKVKEKEDNDSPSSEEAGASTIDSIKLEQMGSIPSICTDLDIRETPNHISCDSLGNKYILDNGIRLPYQCDENNALVVIEGGY